MCEMMTTTTTTMVRPMMAVAASRMMSHGRFAAATTARSSARPTSSSLSASRRHTASSGVVSTTTVRTGACVADSAASNGNMAPVPQPVVKINNSKDPYATVVSIEFGEILGDLLDTVNSLKNLGLNIVRAKYDQENSEKHRFFIADSRTGQKIWDEDRLEEIRMTILNNMMYYHPEAAGELAAGFGPKKTKRASADLGVTLGPRRTSSVKTRISITQDETLTRSMLEITTGDRPGLLVDIVRTLKDVNVTVISAMAETIGEKAHDVFAVTYHGEPLNPPMETLVTNALHFYLARAEVEREESY